jgi:hypothetical protein
VDFTDRMVEYARRRVAALDAEDLRPWLIRAT